MRRVAVVLVFAGAAGAGCGGSRWSAVAPAPGAVYRYAAPIDRYAPDDPGLWVVTARDDTPDGRRHLARLLDDPDDVAGTGFVAWLTDDAAAWLRHHPEVARVVPLQPGDRIAALDGTTAIPVRVDVADRATDAQRDAVIGWLAGRGVRAAAIGPRTLETELTPALARELATLGPVRWIERREAPPTSRP